MVDVVVAVETVVEQHIEALQDREDTIQAEHQDRQALGKKKSY